ncbi:MAG: CDP-alcohol phosphatidyltransferase family protein [Actinomycetota bacterium]
MLNQKIRKHWDRAMRPLGRGVAASGISPDAITLFGVLVQAGAAYLILEGRLLAAGLLTIVAALADVFDGAVAKARGRTGKFGALFDSTTDRLTDALLFIPLAWLYGVAPDTPERASDWIAAVALVALVASFLVSYVKARAESLGFDCDVGIAERAERVIAMIVALVFDIVGVVLVILAVLSIATFLQRLVHVRRQEPHVADG